MLRFPKSAPVRSVPQSEEWRDILGYEGFYQASSDGLVLSLERRCAMRDGQTRRVPQRLLSPTRGARVVKLSHPEIGRVDMTTAHAVLLAFVGAPQEGQVAHYKNGDCADARKENVEWSTFANISALASRCPRGMWESVKESKNAQPQ